MSLDSVVDFRRHELSLSEFTKDPLVAHDICRLGASSLMSGMPCRDVFHRKGGFCTALIAAAYGLHVVQI